MPHHTHTLAPLLIGLTGRAGTGKSSVAARLTHEHSFAELAFADPIINMVHSLLADAEIGGEWITERALKEQPTPLGFSYRHLAQTLGTEWGRGLHQDLWIRVAQQRLLQPALAGRDVVISDVRYPNEADFIRRRGGIVVRVLRNGQADVRAHSSEAYTDHLAVATELLNFGSVATLHDQVDRLVHTLRTAAARELAASAP